MSDPNKSKLENLMDALDDPNISDEQYKEMQREALAEYGMNENGEQKEAEKDNNE